MPNDGTPQPATPGNFRENMQARRAAPQPAAPAPTAPESAPAAPPAQPPPAAQADTITDAQGRTIDMRTGLPVGEQPPAPAAAPPDPSLAPESGPPAPDPLQPGDPETPVAAELHGLPETQVLEALRAGELPAELYDYVTITGVIDGEEVPISLADARDGHLRHLDYSRKTQEVAEQRRNAEQLATSALQTFDSWRDLQQPMESKINEMEAILGEDVMLHVAAYIGQRYEIERAMEAPMREHVQRTRREARDSRQTRQQTEQALQVQQQPEQSPHEAANRGTMNLHFGKTMRTLGVPDNAHTRQAFKAHLGAFWDGTTPLKASHIRDAVMAVKQQFAEALGSMTPRPAARPAAPAQRPAAAPAAPTGLPARVDGGAGGSQPTQPEGGATVANFKRQFGGRRLR